MKKSLVLSALLAVIAGLVCCGPAENESAELAAAALKERILRVESGLLPAVMAKGEPAEGYSIAERMEHYNVPGVSVAVIYDGKIEWAKGYGVIEAGSEQAVDSETLFQAASISKPVAAMAALWLVQDGVLNLDEDVNLKLASWKIPENEFTANTKVTLRHLLSHTGGLTVHGFPGYAASAEVPTLVQILDGVEPANTDSIRVDTEPGTNWSYSGGGITVAQQLMLDVSGKPFPALMKEKVLEPLGMSRSTYEQPLPEALAGNAARAHGGDGAMIEGRWHTYPEMAAAGLWTTPSDLARFAIELQKSFAGESNKVLSQETVAEMLTEQMDGYGLGIGVGGEGEWMRFSHGGSNEGYQCYMGAYTSKGMGAAVMTNGNSGSDLAAEILRSLAREYGWPDFKPREIEPADVHPEVMELYAGRYQISSDYVLTVEVDNGVLFVISPDNQRSATLPETGIKFVMIESAIPIEFTLDEEGNVTGAVISFGGTKYEAAKIE